MMDILHFKLLSLPVRLSASFLSSHSCLFWSEEGLISLIKDGVTWKPDVHLWIQYFVRS